jgi:hypothetical protein
VKQFLKENQKGEIKEEIFPPYGVVRQKKRQLRIVKMATNGVDGSGETSADRNVEIWKIKKLIKSLEAARGCVVLFK